MTSKERVSELNPISFKEELEKTMDDHAKELAIGFAKFCTNVAYFSDTENWEDPHSIPSKRITDKEIYGLYLKTLNK